MKISMLRKALICLALARSVGAIAQEYTLSDALSGQKIPLTMKPSQIPEDYRAMKLMGTGGGGLGDMFGMGSMFPVILAMGNNQMTSTESMILQIWPITWTRGDVVHIVGQDYVIAYGMDIAPNSLKTVGGLKKLPPFNLKLKLIKTTEMGSITPTPEWSKERYLRAIALVVNVRAATMRINQPNIRTSTDSTVAMPENNDPNTITKINVLENPTIKHGAQGGPGQPITESDLTNMTAPTIDPKTLPSMPPPTADRTGLEATDNSHATSMAATKTAVKSAGAMRPIDAALYKAALDNAKVVAGSMLLFAQDHNGIFPYVQGTRGALFLIAPYMKGMEAKTMNPVHGGEFHFNMSLAGVSMSDVMNPGQTPIFYDPFMWPNGTLLVGFADSHAMFLTVAEWAMVKRNLQLNLKKMGSPLPTNLGTGGNPNMSSGSAGGSS